MIVNPKRREPRPVNRRSRRPGLFRRGPNHRPSGSARGVPRAGTTSSAGQGDRLGCTDRPPRSAASPPSSGFPLFVSPSFPPTASGRTNSRHILVEPNMLGTTATKSGTMAPRSATEDRRVRRAGRPDATPRRTDRAAVEGASSAGVRTTGFRRSTPNSVNGIFRSGGRTPTRCPLQAHCRSD